MSPSIQLPVGQVDLVQMILASKSLNARLTREQVDAYTKKVISLPLAKQQELYRVLMEEQESFTAISVQLKQSVVEYDQALQVVTQNFMKNLYKEEEEKERAASDKMMSTLLHQVDEV